MKRIALLAALAFAGCAPATEKPAEPAAPAAAVTPAPTVVALTPEGWGDLKIGMTKAEVIAAAGDTKTPDAVGIPGSTCIEFQPKQAPDGLWVMIEDGKLTSVTIAEMSPVKTADGIGLGDTADRVKAQYADQAKVTPHKYQDAPAEYITVWQGGPRPEAYVEDAAARGVVFEIDGSGKVGAIHAGGPSIQYVEGCA